MKTINNIISKFILYTIKCIDFITGVTRKIFTTICFIIMKNHQKMVKSSLKTINHLMKEKKKLLIVSKLKKIKMNQYLLILDQIQKYF